MSHTCLTLHVHPRVSCFLPWSFVVWGCFVFALFGCLAPQAGDSFINSTSWPMHFLHTRLCHRSWMPQDLIEPVLAIEFKWHTLSFSLFSFAIDLLLHTIECLSFIMLSWHGWTIMHLFVCDCALLCCYPCSNGMRPCVIWPSLPQRIVSPCLACVSKMIIQKTHTNLGVNVHSFTAAAVYFLLSCFAFVMNDDCLVWGFKAVNKAKHLRGW